MKNSNKYSNNPNSNVNDTLRQIIYVAVNMFIMSTTHENNPQKQVENKHKPVIGFVVLSENLLVADI
jgi:hypothetical protein